MMYKDLFQFLQELRTNNNRDWFNVNKSRYRDLHEQFIEVVAKIIEELSYFDPDLKGTDAKASIFRIYRDLRFSRNSGPYKINFGAHMAGYGGRKSSYGGYYIHLEPGNCFLGGGVWNPPATLLKRLRTDIYNNMSELIAIMEDEKFKSLFAGFEGDHLKRNPPGYAKEFPHDSIVRYKNYVVSTKKEDAFFFGENPLEKIVSDFKVLYPLNKFLNYTVSSYMGMI